MNDYAAKFRLYNDYQTFGITYVTLKMANDYWW